MYLTCDLSGDTLNLESGHQEHRVQPGAVDLYHLELVALQRVAKSS